MGINIVNKVRYKFIFTIDGCSKSSTLFPFLKNIDDSLKFNFLSLNLECLDSFFLNFSFLISSFTLSESETCFSKDFILSDFSSKERIFII